MNSSITLFLVVNLLLACCCHTVSAQPSPSVPQLTSQPIQFPGQGCVDYDPADNWREGDRHEWELTIVMPWNFGITFDDFLSRPANMIYISPNGYVTFDGIEPLVSVFNAGGSSEPWIAAFLADSNIELEEGGNLWYKQIDENRFAIVWEGIVNLARAVDPATGEPYRNTFQMVLSNGQSPEMGDNTVCLCYKDMQWTSDNDSGFGESGDLHSLFPPGTSTVLPAVVGVDALTVSNPLTNTTMFAPTPNHWRIGQFDRPGTDWNGPDGLSGVSYLDDKTYCFNSQKVIGTPRPNNEDLEPPSTNTPPATPPETPPATPPAPQDPGSNGDPHFKTWKNEHFEYHGQCDIVLAQDPNFANGLGLDVHIRTKMVRFWSYIERAVIRIGQDILELQGTAGKLDLEIQYWINYEYQGELVEFAGFPVTLVPSRTRIDIDLDAVYPGQTISLSAFKEFVKVSFGKNASQEAFGNTVGILGNFSTGETLARDGETVLHDFTLLGQEWQVLPSDHRLFREASKPQFPDTCWNPEDPQGERRRQLKESLVSEEQAESACAHLKDELDRKDCVYDILATQDMDMAGAY